MLGGRGSELRGHAPLSLADAIDEALTQDGRRLESSQ